MDLSPDEVITKTNADFTPRFGSRQRCQSSRQPADEPTSSNTYDNNDNDNDLPLFTSEIMAPAPSREPFVPLHLRPSELQGPETREKDVLRRYAEKQCLFLPNCNKLFNFSGPKQLRSNFRMIGRPARRIGSGGARRFAREQSKPSEEILEKLKVNLDELANELKRAKLEESEDPVKKYLKKVMSSDTIKIFSPDDNGYKILRRERTEKEMMEIKRANQEMLEFVYCQKPQGCLDLNPMDVDLASAVMKFVSTHGNTAFRSGACSLALNFDSFPPKLWRREVENTKTVLLRPVVVGKGLF